MPVRDAPRLEVQGRLQSRAGEEAMMSRLLTPLVIYDLRSLSHVCVCLSVCVYLSMCLQYYKSRQSTTVLIFLECLLSQGRESALSQHWTHCLRCSYCEVRNK